MRRVARLIGVLTLVICLPASARAQGVSASITGTVKDTSGAVLPGVTVEVVQPGPDRKNPHGSDRRLGPVPRSSISARARTTVTFTLTGFSSVKREGIELTGSFTATVNADMKVGARRRDDHGQRRDADRRRAEHAAPDDAQRRDDQRDSDDQELGRPSWC